MNAIALILGTTLMALTVRMDSLLFISLFSAGATIFVITASDMLGWLSDEVRSLFRR